MKFSHQLQFNAVPDWADYYLAYSNIKKLAYQIEKDLFSGVEEARDAEVDERTSLLDSSARANAVFVPALDKELNKIVKFYEKKEKELFAEEKKLAEDIEAYESAHPFMNSSIVGSGYFAGTTVHDTPQSQELGTPSGSAKDPFHPQPRRPSRSLSGTWPSSEFFHDTGMPPNIPGQNRPDTDPSNKSINSEFDGKDDEDNERANLKRRIIDLYVLTTELRSYVNLNQTAFTKITKKYDKVTYNTLKSTYIPNQVLTTHPFKAATKEALAHAITEIEYMYVSLTDMEPDLAVDELKTHLREHIVWERNTIWRDMIGQERKANAVKRKKESKALNIPYVGPVSRETIQQVVTLAGCLAIFIGLLFAPWFDTVEQTYCFAILVLASLLWATETVPLFVTALTVPLLVVCLGVMKTDDGNSRLPAPDATKKIFGTMFSPVIMLLLGGFAIAAALSKYGIAKGIATVVLSHAGQRPSRVLLATMLVATIASMWISNVAAPVLCFSLIQASLPILRTLPNNSSFGPCLILGIALASNVGGMASPISSPQNIIAIANMNPPPTWLQWFCIAIPICMLADIIIWLLLLWSYRPERSTPQIHTIRPSKDPITIPQVFISIVTVGTIVLWCMEHSFESVFGDMGIIAILPLIAFFGTGILTKEDYNNFLWTVITLAMGGIAMGKAVESSGLLRYIASQIQDVVQGLNPFEVFFIFGCLVLCVTTFISHTVGALIILPIVAEVGAGLPDPHPRLLVMGAALICSAAMGLPVSGFPNMNAIMLENEMGTPYLTTLDFLKNGVPSSILTTLIVVTVGYGLMTLLGF
ncbi:hypothetical protein BZG36_03498 [Bifiguratus adelaidae]|uniref:SPX domain-containing protein n=1 Tax=Bifiguratus adelaidae TaxID=1938954 RepID=A0A261XZE9_9FUNG|nr:hypothetical protein BZG36_03498 [Bifiguratus adelaidae]